MYNYYPHLLIEMKKSAHQTLIPESSQRKISLLASSPLGASLKSETLSIEINDDFRRALKIMEKSRRHLFLTGKAGTGESTLLDYFQKKTRKRVAVIAPTGVAALNVRGQTIPSVNSSLTSLLIRSESSLPRVPFSAGIWIPWS